jgi:predicted RNase H-like HicB family nuclease
MRQHVAIVFEDPDSGFAVTFPDLPGCVVFAQSMADAPGLAVWALAEHLNDMFEAGEPIPASTSIAILVTLPQNSEGVAIGVVV